MEKLLQEIENNLATLWCRLEEQGINPASIQLDLWGNGLGFRVGVWTGTKWIAVGLDCMHSREMFLKIINRKKILFRKFGGE